VLLLTKLLKWNDNIIQAINICFPKKDEDQEVYNYIIEVLIPLFTDFHYKMHMFKLMQQYEKALTLAIQERNKIYIDEIKKEIEEKDPTLLKNFESII